MLCNRVRKQDFLQLLCTKFDGTAVNTEDDCTGK